MISRKRVTSAWVSCHKLKLSDPTSLRRRYVVVQPEPSMQPGTRWSTCQAPRAIDATPARLGSANCGFRYGDIVFVWPTRCKYRRKDLKRPLKPYTSRVVIGQNLLYIPCLWPARNCCDRAHASFIVYHGRSICPATCTLRAKCHVGRHRCNDSNLNRQHLCR